MHVGDVVKRNIHSLFGSMIIRKFCKLLIRWILNKLSALIIFLTFFWGSIAYSQEQTPNTIAFEIRTIPSEAKIIIDSVLTGVDNYKAFLKTGSHRIQIEKKGYFPIDTMLVLKSGTENVFDITLSKSFATCILEITPLDALVTIDGVSINTNIVEFSKGNHVVQIAKSGYNKVSDSICITSNGIIQKIYKLDRINSLLSLLCEPESAIVYIDKIKTDSRKIELTQGLHAIDISMDGYESIHEILNIPAGKMLQKSYALNPSLGGLQVRVIPEDADIIVQFRGNIIAQAVGDLYLQDIQTGSYSVTTRKDGYLGIKKEVQVESDKTTLTNIRLAPKYSGMDKIENISAAEKVVINGDEYWYSVFIPGLGQFNQNRETHAAIIWGATVVGGIFYLNSSHNYNSSLDNYDKSLSAYRKNPINANRNLALKDKNTAESNNRLLNASKYVCCAIYLYNLVDAFFNQPEAGTSYVRLYPEIQPDVRGLAYKLHVGVAL